MQRDEIDLLFRWLQAAVQRLDSLVQLTHREPAPVPERPCYPPHPDELWDTDTSQFINEWEISVRGANALRDAGIETVRDLERRFGAPPKRRLLLRLTNVGRRTAAEIEMLYRTGGKWTALDFGFLNEGTADDSSSDREAQPAHLQTGHEG